ncbi:hypothetical protein [Leucobacter ruminantium]|uniref:Uncharacterized protein n=1 Tax=Leucobacter ruminantium TaxID=1289170 RepID=A0A939LZP0_9MICO|nr:hypothetical protein [Leucobacter ruminantium]MBO1805873.1 hypothetical protein [Leucobacter ruminantium]
MTLRFAAKRPAEELDGMQQHEDEFLRGGDPQDIVAVVVMTRHRLVDETGKPRFASVMIKHIEPVEGEDAQAARKMLADAYSKRTGNEPLPIEDVEQPTLTAVEGGEPE